MRGCFPFPAISAAAKRRFVAWWLLPLIAVVACRAAESATIGEYELKAAFLPKLPLFVQWPSQAFKSEGEPLIIGVFGESEILGHIKTAAAGKVIGGRPMSVRVCRESEDARRCHVVFLRGDDLKFVDEMLSLLAGSSVLTVSDAPNFASAGGMVNLVTTNKKVRLEVNLGAVQQAGLRMNPQLLQLAKTVKTTPRNPKT